MKSWAFGLAGFFGVAAYAFGLLISVPVVLWQAFVIHKLWNWYAEPIGLPALTFTSVAGLLILLRAITHKQDKIDGKPKEKEETWVAVANAIVVFLSPATFLIMGWLLK